MSRNLLIVGASARAAAWSARRAGYSVMAADLFADRDLQEMGLVQRVADYPQQLLSIARKLTPDAWFYTGGLENHPSVIDRLAGWHTLWGNPGEVLRNVRDPGQVLRALRGEGLSCPDVRFDASDVPRDGSWLCKPLQSCGGVGITRIEPGWVPETRPGESYYQQNVDGQSYSGVFVAASGRAELLGVTRQLIGAAWSGCSKFGYAGSCGPVTLNPEARRHWQRIGRCLSRSFGLRGLFGVDAIQSNGQVMPLEVNPRYTASVEVIERVSQLRAIALHVNATSRGQLPEALFRQPNRCCGKGILYATEATRMSGRFSAQVAAINRASAGRRIADIPATGESIRSGCPVVSMLVDADDPQQAECQLQRLAEQLRSRLPSSSM